MNNTSVQSDSPSEGFRRLRLVLTILLEAPVLLITGVVIAAVINDPFPGQGPRVALFLLSFLIVAAVIPMAIYAKTWPRRLAIAALAYPPIAALEGIRELEPGEYVGVLVFGYLVIGVLIGIVWAIRWVVSGFSK